MTTTDPRQQQMIGEAMKAIAERRPGRTKLVYDKTKRTIIAVVDGAQAPRALNITADDADMFAVLTISADWLRSHWPELQSPSGLDTQFATWDNDDAFTHVDLGPQPGPSVVPAAIGMADVLGASEAPLRLTLATEATVASLTSGIVGPDNRAYRLHASLSRAGVTSNLDCAVVEIEPALAARRAGLLETTVLRESSVVIIGLGTGGAHVAVELAKCGVGRFTLIDHDRLAVGNVVRHPGGLSQVGRHKARVVRDLILEKNPGAHVDVHPIQLSAETAEAVRTMLSGVNLLIAGTDNRPSKLLINQLCIGANLTALYGGAFRRAYGGRVLRVRPRRSPCYQCMVSAMPEEAADVEISSSADAEAVAYSDRPVPVEPGLSLDVLPVATFLARLALQELVSDKPTTLDVLQRDYDAPWYLWLNRPESGTPYAQWPPLSESTDEMTINRWYGIYLDRDPECPACGDFIASVAAASGIDLDSVVLPSGPRGWPRG